MKLQLHLAITALLNLYYARWLLQPIVGCSLNARVAPSSSCEWDLEKWRALKIYPVGKLSACYHTISIQWGISGHQISGVRSFQKSFKYTIWVKLSKQTKTITLIKSKDPRCFLAIFSKKMISNRRTTRVQEDTFMGLGGDYQDLNIKSQW